VKGKTERAKLIDARECGNWLVVYSHRRKGEREKSLSQQPQSQHKIINRGQISRERGSLPINLRRLTNGHGDHKTPSGKKQRQGEK
jgi:hypothetical protein